jgi:hypothetical protein
VLIAISATKPFTWDRKAPLRMPNTSSLDPEDREFRIDGPRFVAAIETAPEREFPGASAELRLASFRKTIISKSKVVMLGDGDISGRYTDRKGQVIERKFAGPASVNQQVVDFDRWPLTASKWVNQPTKKSPLVISDGKSSRSYDFDAWKITENVDGKSAGGEK